VELASCEPDAIDVFAVKYGAKYDKAVTCLTKEREALLTLFDFPAEHWDHRARQTRSKACATVRHRTVRTKGALSATVAGRVVADVRPPPSRRHPPQQNGAGNDPTPPMPILSPPHYASMIATISMDLGSTITICSPTMK
jgi:hypothetical protein